MAAHRRDSVRNSLDIVAITTLPMIIMGNHPRRMNREIGHGWPGWQQRHQYHLQRESHNALMEVPRNAAKRRQ
jgi:hypothetical protein